MAARTARPSNPALTVRLDVMELSLGRRADYAIRACLDLARHDGGDRRKAREISKAMDVPTSYVPQVLALLVRAGIAVSTAGPQGGYALARPPEEIDLLQIVRATEGDPASSECVLRGGPCRWEDVCAVHVPWSRAQHAMLERLEATTLAELLETDRELQEGTFELPSDVAPKVRSR